MYYRRYIEQTIEQKLRTTGAVLVAGPKFCGKTTTCMRFQKSFISLNTRQAIELARLNPRATLTGDTPRLIDEWQTVPDIWNQVKNSLDANYQFGAFILTGSSTPADKTEIYHSGAGRITPIIMRPMALAESEESEGIVSLASLFDEPWEPDGLVENKNFELSDLAFLLCRGGWPISVVADNAIALEITQNYFASLFVYEGSDNERFRNLKPEILKMVLRSYGRNISTEASIQTILEDVRQNNERTLDRGTLEKYLTALSDLYIIWDMPAWSPKIRSKTSIRSTPTRHFVDTSLACRALGIGPTDLMNDLDTFGLFFEDFAVRDLSVYTDLLNGEVRHYRDNAGLECDAVVHLEDGRWGAIEIKLGGDKLVDEGARTLNLLKRKIENKGDEAPPSFMMILTAVGPLYKRSDDILVVPINMLKA